MGIAPLPQVTTKSTNWGRGEKSSLQLGQQPKEANLLHTAVPSVDPGTSSSLSRVGHATGLMRLWLYADKTTLQRK